MPRTNTIERKQQNWNRNDTGGLCGRPQFTFSDSDYKPHWTTYGSGFLYVQFELDTYHGDLHIQTTEQENGKRSGKEAWATLPREAVIELIAFLQDSLAKAEGRK